MSSISVGQVGVDLILNKKNYNNDVKNTLKSTENSFKSSMKKVGAFIASAFAVKEVVNFTKLAVNAASETQSAWTGLNSIVNGTGNSFKVAQDFITDYTQDGLVSVNEAVTAYKNLLARGYNTKQIEGTMTALKDSASFGRQASYELGEAVVTATEGLKNENSILVDNAGVTKNVAKMWDEYAASIGKTSTSLTQAEKIQAEYNGILKETRFQTGDAITYANTFSGQIQRLKASFTALKVSVGKVVTPIAQLFIPVINGAVNALTNLFNGISKVLSAFGLKFQEVVGKNSNSVSNFTNGVTESGEAAVKAAKKANKAFANVDEINVLGKSKKSDSNKSKETGDTGSSIKIVPTPATDDSVSEAVNGTVTKIMKYIEPLKNINFDNLKNSFNNLKDALIKISPSIFQGLNDFYFNLLVPLAKWKIEEFIPNFLNITAEAVENINTSNLLGVNGALNGLYETLVPFKTNIGNGLLWFYENVLLKLTEWTIEDVLPSFLNILSGALNFVNQAITDVQPLFDWLWNNILQPIAEWTGGIAVDILNGIGDALKWISENEIAMAILEGLAISIGLVTGALVLWNVAVGAWNVIGGIGAAVTTAFGVALNILTSPITLVVLAITALIAIVILLVKHWDDVKEAASKCWDWIVGVWNGACEWFNNTIIQPISNFFSGMWDGLKNGASSAWEGIKSVFSTVATFFKNIFSNAWEGVKKVFSVGGKIFDGIKDGIVNAFKTVVNCIIGGINKVVAIPFKAINKVLSKISGIEILGLKPFSWVHTFDIPEIPKLAKGGYVDRNNPQLAIIGDNTREGEVVTPESKIYDQALKAIKDSGGTGKQQLEITIYHKYEDGKTIIQKVNQAQIDAGEILLLT